MTTGRDAWPDIPYPAWQDACITLHMWTQIVGKFRLAQTPWLNHSWHVPLYVTVRGLTTSPIPVGGQCAQVDFDFVDHRLIIQTSDGDSRVLSLGAKPVATFFAAFKSALAELGIDTHIHGMPNEVPHPVDFAHDIWHHSYDPDAVNRFWRALVQIDRVFKRFRTGFVGKSSPVHFFWGSFDMAVTRFSGRAAPPHPGGVPALPDPITREAYSHEVSSAGFWPGGGPIDYPAFYSYAYPTPAGFDAAAVAPEAAFFSQELGEFLLPYDAVRTADDPDATLMAFLETTSAAAADLGGWDRAALDCPIGQPGVPRAA